MKLKTLKKKIRRLEARLQTGTKKLGKLKGKLEARTTAGAAKAKSKLTARARKAPKTLRPIPKKKRRLAATPGVEPASAKKPSISRTVKKKSAFSPQRRAQLAAAMKARWAAKRAAAEATQSTDRDFALRQVLQSSQDRRDGAVS